MFKVLFVFLFLTSFVSAFMRAGVQSRIIASTKLFGDIFQQNEDCPDKLKDSMGRCPGHAGFTPQICKEDPKSNFASFQAAQKLKKQEAEAAKKAKGK